MVRRHDDVPRRPLCGAERGATRGTARAGRAVLPPGRGAERDRRRERLSVSFRERPEAPLDAGALFFAASPRCSSLPPPPGRESPPPPSARESHAAREPQLGVPSGGASRRELHADQRREIARAAVRLPAGERDAQAAVQAPAGALPGLEQELRARLDAHPEAASVVSRGSLYGGL